LSVRFELAPSRRLAAGLVSAHALAGLAVYSVMPDLAGALLAAALLALGAAAAWSRALLRAPRSVRAIELEGEEAAFELANGERLAGSDRRRYVTRYAVALPLGGLLGRTVLVTADMLGVGEFRRLRIWALWNRLPGVAPAQRTIS
jgi:hypothetical protein